MLGAIDSGALGFGLAVLFGLSASLRIIHTTYALTNRNSFYARRVLRLPRLPRRRRPPARGRGEVTRAPPRLLFLYVFFASLRTCFSLSPLCARIVAFTCVIHAVLRRPPVVASPSILFIPRERNLFSKESRPQWRRFFNETPSRLVIEIPLAAEILGLVGVGVDRAELCLRGNQADMVAIERN